MTAVKQICLYASATILAGVVGIVLYKLMRFDFTKCDHTTNNIFKTRAILFIIASLLGIMLIIIQLVNSDTILNQNSWFKLFTVLYLFTFSVAILFTAMLSQNVPIFS